MINFHGHTNYSYCADSDLTLDAYSKCIKSGILEAVCIVDHGMSIYFPKHIATAWKYIIDSSLLDDYLQQGDKLLEEYISQLGHLRSKKIYCGLEVEMSLKGRLIYNDNYRDKLYPIIGSVHFLPTSRKEGFSDNFIIDAWLEHTEKLLRSDIDILGHPFRWISKQCHVNKEIVRLVVEMAKRNGVALELNGHKVTKQNRDLDLSMMNIAKETECKVSFGTDSHSVRQISDFSYHYGILNDLQYSINELNMLKLKV